MYVTVWRRKDERRWSSFIKLINDLLTFQLYMETTLKKKVCQKEKGKRLSKNAEKKKKK